MAAAPGAGDAAFTAFVDAARAAATAAASGAPLPTPDYAPAAAALTGAGLGPLAADAARAASGDALMPAVAAAWARLQSANDAETDSDAAPLVAGALTGLAAAAHAARAATAAATAALAAASSSSHLSIAGARRGVKADVAAAFAAGGDAGVLNQALRRYYTARLAALSAAAGADAPFQAEGGGDYAIDAGGRGENDENEGGMDWLPARARLAERARPPCVASLLGPAAADELAAVSSAASYLGAAGAADAAVAAAACAAVRARAAAAAGAGFDTRALPPVRAWAATVPLALLAACRQQRGGGQRAARSSRGAAARWRPLLDAFAHEAVGAARADQMFDVVVDHPDSAPALADVGACLAAHGATRARVRAALAASTRARLLHAGAATGDVIAQYVATVRALTAVDAGGGLLAAVGAPIRAHLRARSDTVRRVVGALAGGDDCALPGLLDEDEGGVAAAADPGSGDDGDGDEGGARLRAALSWAPPPPPTNPAHLARPAPGPDPHATTRDAVALLASIFGGPDVLASEWRTHLAARLLAAPAGFDADAHVRTLELLRARFGDGGLGGAEVMLKDVADSRRLAAAVAALPAAAAHRSPPRRGAGGAGAVSAPALADGTTAGGAGGVGRLSVLVTSATYWPRARHPDPPLTLPPVITAWMGAYAARYYVLKAPRRLAWRPAAGVATLRVSVGGREATFEASPAEAAVLLKFGDAPEWTVAGLAAAVGTDVGCAARAAARWAAAGVLVPAGPSAFARATALPTADGPELESAPEDDGDADASDGGAADAAVAAFVVGMLTNFEAGLPVDRVHNMLKMFATDPPYGKRCERWRRERGGWGRRHAPSLTPPASTHSTARTSWWRCWTAWWRRKRSWSRAACTASERESGDTERDERERRERRGERRTCNQPPHPAPRRSSPSRASSPARSAETRPPPWPPRRSPSAMWGRRRRPRRPRRASGRGGGRWSRRAAR